MTAVVALQNRMETEYDEEMPYMASTTDNEITENNGSESKVNSKKENDEKNSQPSLESMGLQPEAEDDINVSAMETSNAPRGSAKRKSDHQDKTLCEQLLGEVSQTQQEAIDRISTTEGLKQMKKWLEHARSAEQNKHLCMLLAQCWKANINVNDLSNIGIGKLVREFKKHPDKDVKNVSTEVLKKWKAAVENDEKWKAKNSASQAAKPMSKSASKPYVASKPPVQASSSASFVPKLQPSTPIMPKIEKKKESITRPTARVKTSKPRKTGLEGEDDEEEESRVPPSKKTASKVSASVAKSVVPKKSLGSAVPSKSFMDALSAGSTTVKNAEKLQRKLKKLTPVIDLPMNSPSDPVVTPPTSAPPVPVAAAAVVSEVEQNGPDPGRVPAPDLPRDKRRIWFADDKGDELVLIKYIENVLLNKGHRPSSDMKHADAEAERISLKQIKSGMEEEDEDEEMRTDVQSSADIGNDDAWRPIPYIILAKKFSKELIAEEEARFANVMRAFVAQPEVPLEHPAEPDNMPYAYPQMRAPESIPVDFVVEDGPEQEAMEVDVPTSPNNGFSTTKNPTVSPSVVPVSTNFAQPSPQQVSAPDVTNFQILNNVDVHGAGHSANPPRQIPVPFPLNPIYSVPPPIITQNKPPPQPVPAPAEELVILADEPSKLNAPRLQQDPPSILQKIQSKKGKLDHILNIFGGKGLPVSVSNFPTSSAAAATSTINTDFSIPPPSYPLSNMPPQTTSSSTFATGPAPANDLEIISYDIHNAPTAHFNSAPGGPRHAAPLQPPMHGNRQQRPPPQSSGKICNFFLKGTCTFGNNCYNEHRLPNQPQQQQPMGYRASGPPRFNLNNRGGANNARGGGRFNSGFNKAPFNSSNQNSNNSEEAQDQDNNYYRSRKRSDDFRDNRRRSNRSRSPSPRQRRRRSRSGEESPERYSRRRSRSPISRSSSSPDDRDDYRSSRRRRSPPSSRSASRSPIRSRSQSPDK